MQRMATCLLFADEAEEAARFYTSVVPNSKIRMITYGDDDTLVRSVTFELDGQEFVAMNGTRPDADPPARFSPAVSFMVRCESQDELDRYWTKLSANPDKERGGWLQDKFGMSWQIVPAILDALMSDDDQDADKKARVMVALTRMRKIDIAALQRAYAG